MKKNLFTINDLVSETNLGQQTLKKRIISEKLLSLPKGQKIELTKGEYIKLLLALKNKCSICGLPVRSYDKRTLYCESCRKNCDKIHSMLSQRKRRMRKGLCKQCSSKLIDKNEKTKSYCNKCLNRREYKK